MIRTCFLQKDPVEGNPRSANLRAALARLGPVDVFHTVPARATPSPSPGVRFIASTPPATFGRKVLRHSLVHREYAFLKDHVLGYSDQYDVVFADDLPMLLPAARIARRSRAFLVYGSDEIWVETLQQFLPTTGRWPRPALFRTLLAVMKFFAAKAERRLWKQVGLLVVPSPGLEKHLTDLYGPVPSVVTMSCPRMGSYPRTNKVREVLGFPPEVRVVLYQGMLNQGRRLEFLVESAQFLDPGTVLVLIGHGPLAGALKDLARSPRLAGRVHFLPSVPYEELLSYTSSADLGVLLLDHRNLSKKLALGNKIFEYMAAGLPSLVSNSPEQARVVTGAACGTTIDVTTTEHLGAFVNLLLRNQPQLETWGRNGRRAFENEYNWENQEARLLAKLSLVLFGKEAAE